MTLYAAQSPHPDAWPRPPCAIPHAWLDRPPVGAQVTVAGLVLVRQRPGTAKGVVFITLEDETGVANIVIWRKTFLAFRRAVVAGRMLRVTGKLERQNGVSHIIAAQIEDVSHMLDSLLETAQTTTSPDDPRARTRAEATLTQRTEAYGAQNVAQEAGPAS